MKYGKLEASTTVDVPIHNGSRRSSSPNQSLGSTNLYGAVILYLCSNGKKIFVILCAFILGTLIGSSFPYYSPYSVTPCSGTAQVQLNDVTETEVAAYDVVVANDVIEALHKNVSLPSKPTTTEVPEVEIKFDEEEAGFKSDQDVAGTLTEVKMTEPKIIATPSKIVTKDIDETLATTEIPIPKYILNTPECKIPKFDPWDKSVLHTLSRLDLLDCGNHPLAYVVGDMLLLNESNMQRYGIENRDQMSCCYSQLILDKSKIKATAADKCTSFRKYVHLKEEFIRVQCNSTNKTAIYTDLFFTVPLKPDVETRCAKIESKNRIKNEGSENKSDGSSPYSIMIIGLDATSRLNFERYLPQTRDYIIRTLGGIEMLGYNKVGDNTFPNNVPLLTGLNEEELKVDCWPGGNDQALDDCPWLWKRAVELGYRTIYGEDSPYIDTFHYVKKGFATPPTDYYMRPLLYRMENEIQHKKDGNVWQCLGNRPQYQVSTSWAFRLMERLSGLPYFGLLWSNSLTHDYPDNLQHADDYLHGSIRDLREDGRLNNTFLIFDSDHGARWGSLRNTPIGRYEEHLPALYIIPPPSFRSARPAELATLVGNSHRLTTNFDLHVTLKNIMMMSQPDDGGRATGENATKDGGSRARSSRGISLFEPIPLNRTCQDAGIDQHWCACDESVTVDTMDPVVLAAAVLVVKSVNNLTSEFRERCLPFELDKVESALREITVQVRERGQEVTPVYHVVVLVQPGDALFEGTVLSNENGTDQHVKGPISRLSLYGNQSACIDVLKLKMSCFCAPGFPVATTSGYSTQSAEGGIVPR